MGPMLTSFPHVFISEYTGKELSFSPPNCEDYICCQTEYTQHKLVLNPKLLLLLHFSRPEMKVIYSAVTTVSSMNTLIKNQED